MEQEYQIVIERFNQLDALENVSTKSKQSGIYCIYFSGAHDAKRIPLYIGQSKNIYSRICQHKTNIRKQLVLSKDDYNKAIEKNSGQYVYCKIASSLINNGHNFNDLNFEVMEYCDVNFLDEREQYYIKYFKCIEYGFNQLNSIIAINALIGELLYGSALSINDKCLKEIKQVYDEAFEELNLFNELYVLYGFYQINYCLLIGQINYGLKQIRLYANKKSKKLLKYCDTSLKQLISWLETHPVIYDCIKDEKLFSILEISVPYIGDTTLINTPESRRLKYIDKVNNLSSGTIEVLHFEKQDLPGTFRCKNCGHEWEQRPDRLSGLSKCPACTIRVKEITKLYRKIIESKPTKPKLKIIKDQQFYMKIYEKSSGMITASNYTSSRNAVDAECNTCGYKWSTRADHLIARLRCARCKKERKLN